MAADGLARWSGLAGKIRQAHSALVQRKLAIVARLALLPVNQTQALGALQRPSWGLREAITGLGLPVVGGRHLPRRVRRISSCAHLRARCKRSSRAWQRLTGRCQRSATWTLCGAPALALSADPTHAVAADGLDALVLLEPSRQGVRERDRAGDQPPSDVPNRPKWCLGGSQCARPSRLHRLTRRWLRSRLPLALETQQGLGASGHVQLRRDPATSFAPPGLGRADAGLWRDVKSVACKLVPIVAACLRRCFACWCCSKKRSAGRAFRSDARVKTLLTVDLGDGSLRSMAQRRCTFGKDGPARVLRTSAACAPTQQGEGS